MINYKKFKKYKEELIKKETTFADPFDFDFTEKLSEELYLIKYVFSKQCIRIYYQETVFSRLIFYKTIKWWKLFIFNKENVLINLLTIDKVIK